MALFFFPQLPNADAEPRPPEPGSGGGGHGEDTADEWLAFHIQARTFLIRQAATFGVRSHPFL